MLYHLVRVGAPCSSEWVKGAVFNAHTKLRPSVKIEQESAPIRLCHYLSIVQACLQWLLLVVFFYSGGSSSSTVVAVVVVVVVSSISSNSSTLVK